MHDKISEMLVIFLASNSCLKKFTTYVNQEYSGAYTIREYVDFYSSRTNVRRGHYEDYIDLIGHAFHWENTSEGRKFWSSLDCMWTELLKAKEADLAPPEEKLTCKSIW
jgi:hypothetical protein